VKKIPTLFQRNYESDRLVRNEVTPGCEWVIDGVWDATWKIDGTACMFDGTTWFKRYDAKGGKPAPEGFVPAQEPDSVTGHWPGWIPVSQTNPADRWFREAIANHFKNGCINAGTFELIGPKINGNKEKRTSHILVSHGTLLIEDDIVPRTFDGLKAWLEPRDMEGIVFHHPDGRMCKIKKKDFGFKR
jgi:hypothetical protein